MSEWVAVCYRCGNKERGELRQTFVGPWCCTDKAACDRRALALRIAAVTAAAGSPVPCVCGLPLRRCPTGPVCFGDPPAQPWMAWCLGWVHKHTRSHRCHWPEGLYGLEGAARPQGQHQREDA